MKLMFCFILFSMLNVSGSIFSQSATFDLAVNGKTVNAVFKDIESQSQYRFLYNDDFAGLHRVVSFNTKNNNIDEVLGELLAGDHLTYRKLENELIVITPMVVDVQQRTVSGTVTDESGEPLPGVTVMIKSTIIGTVTNVDGEYSLTNVPPDAILEFSFVGMSTQEVAVEDRTVINIAMEPEVLGLEEVVVVGYGVQKRATLTGSISNVRGEEVLKAPVTNVAQSLTGRLSGITSVQRSGEPGGDSPIIRIRGINTLGNNSPLIVVDGVPHRSLDRIDPNSIDEITVLKDASAAIYGAQAANGVILITTKRGVVGKPKITINMNQGFQQPTRIPEMADGSEYAIMLNELDIYDGREPRYVEDQIRRFTADDRDIWRYPNTDWFSEVLKPWSAQNNLNAELSGGGEDIRYFVSVGSRYQDAYFRNSINNYKQYDFRSNIDGRISENINLGIDLHGSLQNRMRPPQGMGPIWRTTTLASPNTHAIWPDGKPGPDVLQGYHPMAMSTDAAGRDDDKVYVFNSNFTIDVTVPWIDGLSFKGNASLDKSFQNRKLWQTPYEVNTWDGETYDENNVPVRASGMVPFVDPRLTQYMYDNQTILLGAIVNYEQSFNDIHNFNFLAGTESRVGEGNNFNAFRRHYVSTAIPELFAGGGQDRNNSGSSYQHARLNYFGRVNYNLMEKYLFEFVWRYDGSYIFPKENRFGFFPGVSLGWRISEENFWRENIAFINDLKIRASYGETGNDRIGAWQYISSYGYRGNVYNFGINQNNQMLYEARIPNDQVTWEVAQQANVGFDAYFADSKLYVEFDYYEYRRSNILWWRDASIPQSTGFSLPRENIGKVTNKGYDFNIIYRDNIQNFGYNMSLMGGYAKNEITFWDEPPGAPEWQRSTGRPMNTQLYYEAIGIFSDWDEVDAYPSWDGARPGDIIFKDVNGDGVIDGDDMIRMEKSNIPTFTGGLNIGMNYNGFDLSILFQGAAGAVRYISTESGQIGNFTKEFYDNRWTPDNQDASGPRAYNRDAEYWRSNRNTYWVRNSDYIRLKTMEIGYTLPESANRALGIDGLRVYVSGYNLLTWTPDMKDWDPETDQGGLSGQSQPYGAQRVVNGGIRLNF